MSEGRRMNRTLTQRYDMHSLRALQTLESELVQKLSAELGIEEDDMEIDILTVYNSTEDKKSLLASMIPEYPAEKGGAEAKEAVINGIIDQFAKIDSMPK